MINAFHEALKIEQQGMDILLPWIQNKIGRGTIKILEGIEEQKKGDLLVTYENGKTCYVELKVEQRYTGNLYIQCWSNRSKGRVGWLWACDAEKVLYYFLDKDILCSFQLEDFRNWFCALDENYISNGMKYSEIPQRKMKEKNDSWGYCIPIRHLIESTMRIDTYSPKIENKNI